LPHGLDSELKFERCTEPRNAHNHTTRRWNNLMPARFHNQLIYKEIMTRSRGLVYDGPRQARQLCVVRAMRWPLQTTTFVVLSPHVTIIPIMSYRYELRRTHGGLDLIGANLLARSHVKAKSPSLLSRKSTNENAAALISFKTRKSTRQQDNQRSNQGDYWSFSPEPFTVLKRTFAIRLRLINTGHMHAMSVRKQLVHAV